MDLERRSSWITQVGPKSNDKCPYDRQKRKHRDKGGAGDRKTEVETELINGHRPRTPGATRSWKKQSRTLP